MKHMPILIVVAYVIIVAGLISIFAKMTINRANSHAENAQNLVTNCILSVTPNERTHQSIENCYLRVERDNNIKLNRYYANE